MMSFLSLPSVKPLGAVYFQSIKIQRDSASFLSKTFPCLSLPQRSPLLVVGHTPQHFCTCWGMSLLGAPVRRELASLLPLRLPVDVPLTHSLAPPL